ncbi:MAG: GNAT family N-acetyltransferase, partial [Thermoplasmata archaeon]|nr:GNAT family N-acetyltransferase [Thermoplasmata archaeon]
PVFINDLQDDPSSLGWHAWMVIEKKSSMIIGDVGFKGPPEKENVVEIGFSIVPSRRGSGYAAEAVSSMVEYALSKHGTIRLTAECSLDNRPSLRILETCGFHRSGRVGENLLFRRDQ